MDTNALRNSLRNEFGYPSYKINSVISKIKNMDDEVKVAFEEWYTTRKIVNVTKEGYSIRELIEKHDMKIVGAYLMMDWLFKDPETAKESLKYGCQWSLVHFHFTMKLKNTISFLIRIENSIFI